MKIGIIGTGKMGSGLGRVWAAAGHQVFFGSRDTDKAKALAAEVGAGLQGGTFEQAAEFGDIVLLSVPGFAAEETAQELANVIRGKALIDLTNVMSQTGFGLFVGTTTSMAEIIAERTGAKVVKAFNTMYYETLGSGGRPDAAPEERLVLFVAGDDAEAKAVVSGLIEEIGFTPVDVGSLEDGRKQQPGSPIYNVPMNEERAREILADMDREGTR